MRAGSVTAIAAMALLALILARPAIAEGTGAPEATGPLPAWMQLSPEHEGLASAAGTWRVASRFWMDPNAPPQTGEATAVRTLILGGRVLEEVYTSTIMGLPFEGRALTGYDPVTDRYWGVWSDTMNPGAAVTYGAWDEDSQMLIMEGESPNQMLGRMMPIRIEARMDSPDRMVQTFFTPDDQGAMVQYLELIYERE